jgi:SAM-dependent methyltransferase
VRVADLDRDMRDVIPTGVTRDSVWLFERMTARTLALARGGRGRRILDVASGFGQDAAALAERGALAVAAEPSARMSALARISWRERAGPLPLLVRSWADALPFADASFDAVICKGSLDHFDWPERALSEMARVARPTGTVVLAIANFESLACRLGRAADRVREGWLGRELPRGRRKHDVPHDHFTRYELPLMREQAGAWLELEVVEGVSLLWGVPAFSRCLGRLPAPLAQALLAGLGWLARRAPALADVAILAGRPRRSATTSA